MGRPQIETRSCSLDLFIKQDGKVTVYHVRPLDSDIHLRAYQIRKDDGTVYHVGQEPSGKIECDCGDAIFKNKRCKHTKAAYRLGLFLRPREIVALQQYERKTDG